MGSDYMFLCGVMWCRFGQPEAGKELVRAATSMDPDMRALAWAMLVQGALRLRDLERTALTGSRYECWVKLGRHGRWTSTLTT